LEKRDSYKVESPLILSSEENDDHHQAYYSAHVRLLKLKAFFFAARTSGNVSSSFFGECEAKEKLFCRHGGKNFFFS
jgi:hypothetical protein